MIKPTRTKDETNTVILAIVILFAVAGLFLVLNTVSQNNELHREIKQSLAEINAEPVIVKEYVHHIVEVEKEPALVEVDLPTPHKNLNSMLDYRKITNTKSKQYGYILLSETEKLSGLLTFDGRYMVAMGSYYGDLGTKYDVLLTNGETIRVIVTERKDDKHTDPTNRYQKYDGSILEFIVDKDVMADNIWQSGDIFNIIGGYPERIWRVE